MEFLQYLSPVDVASQVRKTGSSLFEFTTFYLPGTNIDFSEFQFVIIGLTDDRNSNNEGTMYAASTIRQFLYNLQIHTRQISFLDLGDIITGATVNDTHFAVREVVASLINLNVFIVMIGASQDMMFPILRSSLAAPSRTTFSVIDSSLDIGNTNTFSNTSLICHLASLPLLPRVSFLASQSYLIPASHFDFAEKNSFKLFRLGKIRHDINKAEPVIRDSFALFFDIGAIRQSDAPGNANVSPNGLYAEEACQLCRYFGLSDQSRLFHISEINPSCDIANQTSHLAAQLLWHVFDGYVSRKNDYPAIPLKKLQKIVVSSVESLHDITFYKSLKSDRWWIEIDNETDGDNSIIPCNFEDYQIACSNHIPDIYVSELSRKSL